MRILITGASGFLGGHLTRHLTAAGHEVLATGRNRTALQALGVQSIAHDLSLSPIPALPQCEAVVHAAALSAPYGPLKAFEAVNVTATRHLLQSAAASGCKRLVNISSPSIYFSYCDQRDIGEGYPLPPPVNHYAQTKAEAEALVLEHRELGPINLRPRGIYGPGDAALMPRLVATARRGPLPLFRQGRAAIDLTHVSDVCRAVEAALLAPKESEGESFNISSGEMLPIRRIVEDLGVALDLPIRWRTLPFGPTRMVAAGLERLYALRTGHPEPPVTQYALGLFAFAQSLDISKARRLLGWQPQVSFSQGLARTLKEGAP